ncbi:hypothetical protein [Streptococcus pneumoniae]|nr:hypothetical protein [Streptococcus pneumoniae]
MNEEDLKELLELLADRLWARVPRWSSWGTFNAFENFKRSREI